MNDNELMKAVLQVARDAGTEIMAVYHSGGETEVTIKADDSPLTEADTRANTVIVDALLRLTPEIPILSEESASVPWSVRQHWQQYWLVDPLDGTKEFISRNDEFTVNIALVRAGVPVLGVVHVPATGCSYMGIERQGAWRQLENPVDIRTTPWPVADGQATLRVVASRRHGGEALQSMLDKLARHYGQTDLLNMGSSLKICLLAEGRADLYPRLAPTSEWDTAAAHAVLLGAGGDIFHTDFSPLRYNLKESLLNPSFIAMAAADPSPLQAIVGSA